MNDGAPRLSKLAGTLVWFCGLLCIGVVITGFQLDRASRYRLEIAQYVPAEFRSFAQLHWTRNALLRSDNDDALRQASLLVAKRPVAAEHLSLLGSAALLAGDDALAAKAFTISARRGWREPGTQVIAMQSALAQADWSSAAERVDALARGDHAQPDIQQTIDAGLQVLLADPAGREALVARLLVAKNYRLLDWLARPALTTALPSEIALVLADPALHHADCKRLVGIAQSVLKYGSGLAAQNIVRNCAKAESNPFAWQYPDKSGLFVSGDLDDGSFRTENSDPLKLTVAERFTAFPTGKRRLIFRRKQGSVQLRASVICRDAQAEAYELASFQEPGEYVFEVPDNCPVQQVRLQGGRGRASGIGMAIE